MVLPESIAPAAEPTLPGPNPLADRVILTQVPLRALATPVAPDDIGEIPDGSRIVVLDDPARSDSVRVMTTGFLAAGRPDVSFDGGRFLFIARRHASDSLNVWEMPTDGGEPRQITHESADCTAAVYLSPVYSAVDEKPVRRIAYVSRVGGRTAALSTCLPDGRQRRRVTFGDRVVRDPFQLSDGRLLFSSAPPKPWPSSDASPSPRADAPPGGDQLMTTNPDGSDLCVFTDSDSPRRARRSPCELDDGRVVFTETDLDEPARGADLVSVRRAASLRTRRRLADAAGGRYRDPWPLPDGNLLVSYGGPGDESFDLYRLDPQRGALLGPLLASSDWHELHARPLRPRCEPAGRSSVVDDRKATAQVYCLDVTVTDDPGVRRPNAGEIQRLRVFRAATPAEPPAETESSDASRPTETLLGEIPVEPDGSFFIEVPARAPLRFETLDAAGRVVRAMRGAVWVMPNEVRGCIGCHEDAERAPPNRHVLALQRPPHHVGLPAHKHAPEPPPRGEFPPVIYAPKTPPQGTPHD